MASSSDGHDPTRLVKPDGYAITYDIFSGESDRDARWLEAVVGINQARARMQQIADSEPGDYFVFNAHGGGIVASVHTEPNVDGKDKPQSEVG